MQPPPPPALSAATLLLGAAVGLGTPVLAALGPAWAVVSQPLVPALHLGAAAPASPRRGRRLLLAAGAGFAVAIALLAVAPRSLPYAPLVAFVFTVNSMVLTSFALLSPAVTAAVGRALAAAGERARGLSLLLASAAVSRNPAAPVAVAAAIVLALGWILANASLIASMKGSWLRWLDEHYQSDLLVSAGEATISLLTYPPFSDTVVDELRAVPGVREVQGIRTTDVHYAGRPVVLLAADPATRPLPLLDGQWSDVAPALWSGEGVLATENLAYKARLRAGSVVTLPTPAGAVSLPVLGVFADFQGAGDLGGLLMARARYRQLFGDEMVSRARVWLEPGADASAVRIEIQRRYTGSYGVRAATFAETRAAVAELVENAFAITYALIFVALVVSFVGVTNFLLAAVLDRRPVLHTLIALGVRPGQIAAAVVTEGCMLGAIGVALGLVAGVVVSRVIVLHSVPMINGWHFQYIFPGATAAGLCIASLAIAALAGIGPARLATRRQLAAPEGEE